MSNKEKVINERVKHATDFINYMNTAIAAVEAIEEMHKPKGELYKLSTKVLECYKPFKFYAIAEKGILSYNSLLKEIIEKPNDYYEYRMSVGQDVLDVASLYDIVEICQNSLTSTRLEEFISSNLVSYKAIIVAFCERILDMIRIIEPSCADVLYIRYFSLEDKRKVTNNAAMKTLGLSKDAYYPRYSKGITLFSQYFFTPFNKMNIEAAEEEKVIVEQLNKSAGIILEAFNDISKKCNPRDKASHNETEKQTSVEIQ